MESLCKRIKRGLNGCIAIENNIIKEVGDIALLRNKYQDEGFIDAGGKIIMPGLINTHHHIYSAFVRGLKLSNNSLLKCTKAMNGLNEGYHIHIAEGIEDLQQILRYSGKRVVERLMDYGILGEKNLAVHCVHINEGEVQLLKKSNTNIVNNPESNMGNAVGCAPVIKMLEKGLRVGIGTDGYTSDIFESMKVENIIHKHTLCDSNVGFLETSKMTLENNKEIASKYFNNPLGVLKELGYADLIIFDYNPLTPMN